MGSPSRTVSSGCGRDLFPCPQTPSRAARLLARDLARAEQKGGRQPGRPHRSGQTHTADDVSAQAGVRGLEGSGLQHRRRRVRMLFLSDMASGHRLGTNQRWRQGLRRHSDVGVRTHRRRDIPTRSRFSPDQATRGHRPTARTSEDVAGWQEARLSARPVSRVSEGRVDAIDSRSRDCSAPSALSTSSARC